MPTYTINMDNGSRNAWGEGASALAKALTPDYKGEAARAGAAAQAEAAYARSAASLASRDKTLAETFQVNRENDILRELDTMTANGEISNQQALELATRAGIRLDPASAAANVGDIGLGLTGFDKGVTPDQQNRWQIASGMNTANTIGGFDADQRRQSQEFIMGEAGETVRNNADNENALLLQREKPLNITENSTTMVPPGHPLYNAQNEGVLSGQYSVGDTETVYRPGQEPLVGGGVTDPTENGFTGLEGTGMDQQAVNLITQYNIKKNSGQATSPAEDYQYLQLFNRSYGQETREIANPDGTKTLMQVQKPVPPGIYNPNTGQVTGSADAATGADEVAAAAATQSGDGADGSIIVNSETVGNPRQKLTEGQQKLKDLGGGFVGAVSSINALSGYDLNTNSFPNGGNFPGVNAVVADSVQDMFNNNAFGSWASNVVRDENSQSYNDVVFNMSEPLLRFRSGAATPEEEIRRYRQYAPQAGLSEAENQRRVRNLNMMAIAIAQVAAAQGLTSDALMALGEDHPAMGSIRAAVNAELAALVGGTGDGAQAAPAETPVATQPTVNQQLIDRWATQ